MAYQSVPRQPVPRHRESLLVLVLTWIVGGIQVFEAQRTNGRYLGHVLTGFRPVEVGRIAGQNDDATGRIRLHLVTVELIAQADVENAGDDRVDSVLRYLSDRSEDCRWRVMQSDALGNAPAMSRRRGGGSIGRSYPRYRCIGGATHRQKTRPKYHGDWPRHRHILTARPSPHE